MLKVFNYKLFLLRNFFRFGEGEGRLLILNIEKKNLDLPKEGNILLGHSLNFNQKTAMKTIDFTD